MWLQSITKEDLEQLVREGECCQIATGLDGEIYWASDEMCDWTGYTLHEIMKLGWVKLSVDDENLDADMAAANEMKSGERSEYQVEKKYRKKCGTEQWGLLHVKRHPRNGDFRFAWCHWTPFHNGTQIAFQTAMDFQSQLEKRFAEMTAEVRKLSSQSEDDAWVVASVRMARRHPKVSMMLFIMVLSIFGANNVLELLQRVGLTHTPVTVKQMEVKQ